MGDDSLSSCRGLCFLLPQLVGTGFAISAVGATSLYTFSLALGYTCLFMAGVWMSRLLKNNLMDDVFNLENESFMQETRLMENEYSVNLPTCFYYRKRWNKGWINIVNPFRASMVLGTPGSGKSYAIVDNYIKQQIEKVLRCTSTTTNFLTSQRSPTITCSII